MLANRVKPLCGAAFFFFMIALVACSAGQAGNDNSSDADSNEPVVTPTPESEQPAFQEDSTEGAPENDAAADQDVTPAQDNEQGERPAGWADETHGNDVSPNYEVVFPQNKVNQLSITIAPADWESMQADMTELYARMIDQFDVENPMWAPATVNFAGKSWTNVGVRYKGDSSLRNSWKRGMLNMPLKLDFDEFEGDHPEIRNQRFYGFKQLSFMNGAVDATLMRDVVAYDLLENAGLVAAQTAHYEIIFDYGEGPVSLGVYTAIEVIEDTVIKRFFGDDNGNIYKPTASLVAGSQRRIRDDFEKQNNEQEADWGDIEVLYNALHSEARATDPEAWRESLEAIFDVDVFLNWLAISAVIQHWDTYGSKPKNYYLYNDPSTGRLTWISWDHNLALRTPANLSWGREASFGKEEIGEDWPLIRYLLDDPTYYDIYVNYLEKAVNGLFNPDDIAEKCQELAALVRPYILKEADEGAFEAAVQDLISYTYQRAQEAADFLSSRNGPFQ